MGAFTTTQFNGTLNQSFLEVFGIGGQTAKKGLVHVIPNVVKQTEIYRGFTSEDPFVQYTNSSILTDSVDFTMKSRLLTPVETSLKGSFVPHGWLKTWAEHQAGRTITNLKMHPTIFGYIMRGLKNSASTHLDKLYWQADTASGNPKLAFYDGFIKQIETDSDGDVINVPPVDLSGVISAGNISAILDAIYLAIPELMMDNPDLRIIMNTQDWKILQLKNKELTESTLGILGTVEKSLFIQNRIEHLAHVPKNTIVTTLIGAGDDSNLKVGVYANMDAEYAGLQVEIFHAMSKQVDFRMDMASCVNYVNGGDIIYYKA